MEVSTPRAAPNQNGRPFVARKRRTPRNPKYKKNVEKKEPANPNRIDIGNVVETIRREKFIRQQETNQQSAHIVNDLQKWKNKNDKSLKDLKEQMEILEKRKAQIRMDMAEMNELADRLRERLAVFENNVQEEEPMQS